MRLGLLFLASLLLAQQSIRDSAIAYVMLGVVYGGVFPMVDLAKRFGYLNHIQAELGYKFKSHFYIVGLGGGLVGDKVREPGLLSNYLSASLLQAGYMGMFDENGKVFAPTIRAAGWSAQLRLGKIFPAARLPGQNPNCGPFIELGGGYLRHRISIDKARSDRAPLLEGDYLKGVDRLTGGWGLVQSVGYRFFSSKLLLNFFIALDAGQYLTRSLRGYTYDTGQRDTERRLDSWWSLRLGWMLLLYEKAPLDE